ncbi:MAG: FAD-dependent oxidoreductase [Christensenella sp.]|nr:FAD-dependent oxidoreductase [Christensenella sp.]
MFDQLFQPLKINGATIKNRLMVPAMVTNLATNEGMCTEALVAYHAAKAKGGWGLVITEDYAVEPAGRGYQCVPGLWNDEQGKSHSAIPKAIHEYQGAKVFAQIYHCGRQTSSDLNGGYQPVSASPIPCPSCRCMPRELKAEEVEALVTKFADAAQRAKRAGFDGIEIHGGHGYLIAQFMSPYSNKRIDQYGGNLINRMRFPLEIIKAVRQRVGKDFPIGFRISADEKMPGSRTLEDTLVIVKMLEEQGVDVLNVSVGTYGTPVVVAPMQFPHGWIVEFSEKVKQVVKIPVITVNRITDPMMANQIIEMGRADIVAMGRASLADPEFPNKAKCGNVEDIRSCIGCIVCDNSLVRGGHVRCSVNPVLAYEQEGDIKKARNPQKVIVVGAGPAGMEAARTAAMRGHDVIVYEKNKQPGGQFRAAAFPPYKGELSSILTWQWQQCRKAGVKFIFDTEFTPEIALKEKAQKIIVASGPKPLKPPIPGVDKPHVVYAYDVLLGQETGQNIVVAGGGSVGVETACFLGMQNKNVAVVEMTEHLVAEEDDRIRGLDYELMDELKIEQLPCTKVVEITNSGIVLQCSGKSYFRNADTVVLALGYRSDSSLYTALKEVCDTVVIAGDAKQARKLVDAVREGYLAGAEI